MNEARVISPTDVDATETLATRAYAQARRDIIEGRLKPGAKLKIEELRLRYQMGGSPIREALSLLTSDGLVERIDQRGFRVAKISRAEFDDILRVRCWLEERALRESILNGESQWEEALVLAAYRLSKEPLSDNGDQRFIVTATWEKRHKAFHSALLAACGSPMLIAYCDQLYDKNIRYRHLAGHLSYPNRDTQAEHDQILAAALDRDADLAVKRLTDHYRKTGSYLARTLS